jgi:hypothetical protein
MEQEISSEEQRMADSISLKIILRDKSRKRGTAENSGTFAIEQNLRRYEAYRSHVSPNLPK